MNWRSVDTNQDLRQLDESVVWDDSQGVEYYGTNLDEDYFPGDVSRSGYLKKNIFVLCRSDSSEGPYLEMVFIDCDPYRGTYLDQPFMQGRADSLKRVEIWDCHKELVMRCSRLIYRFLREADVVEGKYYRTCWNQG